MASNSNVKGQDLTSCGVGCCGCNSTWAGICQTDIPECAPCTGTAPPQIPDSYCSNGRWIINSSYTGPLTISAPTLLLGDYSLPKENLLLFIGFGATLNITGAVTIREAVTSVLNEKEMKHLKDLGRYTRKQVTYMTVGSPSTLLGASMGKNVVFYVHSKRACQSPSAVTTGDVRTFSVSYRWATTCDTWWIMLVCILPSVLIAGLGGVVSAAL